jgi:hypothetical protein
MPENDSQEDDYNSDSTEEQKEAVPMQHQQVLHARK